MTGNLIVSTVITKCFYSYIRKYSGYRVDDATQCACINRGLGEHCWSAEHLGCFRDEINRAVGTLAGLTHSVRHCAQLCTERLRGLFTTQVVAIGNGEMCYCSREEDDYRRYGASRSTDDGSHKCTSKCRASRAWTLGFLKAEDNPEWCGNSRALSVYKVELSKESLELPECAVEKPREVIIPPLYIHEPHRSIYLDHITTASEMTSLLSDAISAGVATAATVVAQDEPAIECVLSAFLDRY